MSVRPNFTFRVTIDAAGSLDPIQVPDNAPAGIRRIELSESTGTHAWYYAAPLATSQQVYQQPGRMKVFDGGFGPGEILGYGASDTGTIFLDGECYS